MPKIEITTTENLVPLELKSTDNVFLAPLLVKADQNAALYTDTDSFKKDFMGTETTSVEADKVQNVAYSSTTEEPDRSYYMIYQLIALGLKALVVPITATAPLTSKDSARTAVNDAILTHKKYDVFNSKNVYNIKFITTGYYDNSYEETNTSTASAGKLKEIAEGRGDAIALIESARKDTGATERARLTIPSESKNCAMFYPKGTYSAHDKDLPDMPAAYAYLNAYALSTQTYPDWFAAAGVNRGKLYGLKSLNVELTEADANTLQGGVEDVSINPIMRVGANGQVVYGNRTLTKESATTKIPYTNFLNVQMLVCDIKKQIYDAAVRCTFEPNDSVTWIQFTNLVNVLLDDMKKNRGLIWYKWEKLVSTDRATISGQLSLQPVEAVENFVIKIKLTEDGAETE